MKNVLDFYADRHTAFIHANGREGTYFLISKMALQPGERVLEIGFGTGQTLVEMACFFPKTQFFGIEKSLKMRQIATRRLQFSGLKKIELAALPDEGRLPFDDGFFDAVYCESVLAILPAVELEKMFHEVNRVLKNSGSFFFNESLWRAGVSVAKIQEINDLCEEAFGIPQASDVFPHPENWRALAEINGFSVVETVHLEGVKSGIQSGFCFARFRSACFTFFGKISAFFNPRLRRFSKKVKSTEAIFSSEKPYLEGIFFHLKKDEKH